MNYRGTKRDSTKAMEREVATFMLGMMFIMFMLVLVSCFCS